MKKRITAFLLLAVMLLCCLAGCKGSDSEGELSGYAALTSNKDKLFYLADRPEFDFGSDDLTSVVGEDTAALIESFKGAETARLEGAIDVTKAKVEGVDYLESIGGTLGLELLNLSNKTGSNTDVSVKMNGMSIKADIDADKDGVLITAPFVVTKPVYLDFDLLQSSLSESEGAMGAFSDYRTYVKAFEDYCNSTLTEENLAHVATLLMDSVPEDCITAEKVSPEELKGDYITVLTETECITLTLNGAQLKTLIESLGDKLAEDEGFKSLVTGFIACLPPQLVEAMEESEEDGGESVLPLAAESAEDKTGADADAIFSKLVAEIKGLAADVKEDAHIIVKRYFADGISVRFDLTYGNSDEDTAVSLWNITKDDACQYGITVGGGEECLFSLIGGSKGSNASSDMLVKGVDKDYSFNENEDGDGEYYVEDKTYYDIAELSATKAGDKLTANVKAYDDKGKTVLEASLNADCGKGVFVLDGKMSDGNTFGLDGTLSKANGASTLSGNATLKAEGIKLNANYTFTVKEGFYSADFVVTAKDDSGNTDLAVDLRLSMDTKAEVTVDAPARSDKDYIVDSLEDVEGISELLSPFIKDAIGGSEGEDESL
ncbi:MAG: hypothetical protein IKK83_02065 [Clostridia bacterium]|nr:hypothetical protein [Clostridia bacterium]